MRGAMTIALLSACGRLDFGSLPARGDATGANADAADDALGLVDGGLGDGLPDGGLADGVIAYWPLDENPAGGTVLDASGNGHAATCAQCPGTTAGWRGNAISCNDTSQYLIAPDSPAFATPALTVAAWVRPRVQNDRGAVMGKLLGTGIDNSWQLLIDDDGTPMLFTSSGPGTGRLMSALQVAPLGEWVHVAATWDGVTRRLYVGGAEQAAEPELIVYDTGPIYLCADSDNGNLAAFFDGDVDEVYVFDRALSPAELDMLRAP